jgi:O-antigen/teichoic acid export membrane protein
VIAAWGKIKALLMHSLARNSGWMFFGLGGNALLQAGAFILLARLLGVTEYGVFAGAFALVNTVTPYSSLGSQMIFMRHVSADRDSAPVYWGNMVAITAATTIFLTGALAFIGKELLGRQTVALIAVLVFAGCFMSQITNNASIVFQTFEEMKSAAWLRTLSNLLRVLSLAVLIVWFRHATAFECSLAILVSSAIAALLAGIWVRRVIGRMRLSEKHFRMRFWEGIGFSFAGSTTAVYNDVDKMMLSHFGMNAADGIYTLAYRVVDFATIPVNSIDIACLPRYFTLNNNGFAAVVRLAKRVVPIGAVSGLLAAGLTLLASPFVVRLAGHEFAETVVAFRWLCWLPALRGIHQLTGGVLTSTGLQNYRTGAQFTTAILNVVLNLILIPSHGWLGAAWASLASDGALAALNGLLVLLILRKFGRLSSAHVLEEV